MIKEVHAVSKDQTNVNNHLYVMFNELKDMLAARQPFGAWSKRITKIDTLIKSGPPAPAPLAGTPRLWSLISPQLLAGDSLVCHSVAHYGMTRSAEPRKS